VFYNINDRLGQVTFGAVDVGGSMFVHAFGAYFGLGCAWVLGRGKTDKIAANDNNGSNKTSDTFAMIGTVFLWVFWPSFIGALAVEEQKHRCVINTVISLSACCFTAFLFSSLFRDGRKFDMVDIQNATLAGGVAVGSVADLNIQPWAACVIGTVAAMLSVVGYTKIQPCLENTIGLFDTCGINNLHGMPGIMGGLGGVVAAFVASDATYPDGVDSIYPARATISATQQGLNQLLALTVSVGMGICAGMLTGGIAKGIGHLETPADDFNDGAFWHEGEKEVGAYQALEPHDHALA
jgi:ammonium transporter Rh